MQSLCNVNRGGSVLTADAAAATSAAKYCFSASRRCGVEGEPFAVRLAASGVRGRMLKPLTAVHAGGPAHRSPRGWRRWLLKHRPRTQCDLDDHIRIAVSAF